ncbi:HPr family phosphocarrier protein [Halorhodospira halochloris]|uniref:Phosphocarrier protein n=1 Tax=Halorhodospira halochloris TaxID=1052 RepID=A0A0X8XAM2_HALHR|nr:HPr family phosphocarrier protein [Halorhodospira halochloris]MBK1651689.1 phosphocarrier protein HPr [Halorhodospira halochloris]MCG5529611.1 HPr family phosphocarrier protein [Halorhodospira halochloris]BAU58552.1 phosphocarrier protein [Halorhodospira halochloris]
MTCKEAVIQNRLGLHARAAARFVSVASGFKCDIHVCSGDKKVNGKSIMGLMMLAAGLGTQITIEANGQDEELAARDLAELVENGFGEDPNQED